MVRRALQCWENQQTWPGGSASRNGVACSEQRLQSSRQTVELKAGKQSIVRKTTAGKSLLEYRIWRKDSTASVFQLYSPAKITTRPAEAF